jgi:hypothetical protein
MLGRTFARNFPEKKLAIFSKAMLHMINFVHCLLLAYRISPELSIKFVVNNQWTKLSIKVVVNNFY